MCSPELVANLSQDYSVYAYDYSEQGVPLVGCGLLSWAMTAVNNSNHGSDNPAPARHIITGRISCNNFGFFSNDEVKETLEVKFKLMPVQTFTQAQFVQSVHTYNALSKAIPGGFDASAWTNYLNQHPNILAPPAHYSSAPGLMAVQSRVLGTPLLAEAGGPQQSRPLPKKPSRDGSATSSEENGEPPKKKARTNAGRARKPNGGSRKKATTSLPPAPLSPIPELFPSPVTKFKEPLHITQVTPTPPPAETPVELPRRPSLSCNPEISSPENENSPAPQTINSTVMASSPPIGPEEATEEARVEFSPEPTSPILPSLPPNEESQGLSQVYDRGLECLEDVKPDVANIESPPGELLVPIIPEIEQETTLLTALKLPTVPMLSTLPDDITVSAAPSPSAPNETTKAKPKPKRKYPKKPKTVVNSGAINSDAVASSEIGEEGRKIKRSKSEKAARTAANVKERIHAQMVAAIEQGKMPNFCMNCGAIETPTWRKVSMKDEGVEGEGDAKGKKEKEVLLCNPCGLWHGSHKTMRPQDYWDGKKEEPAPKKSRPKKKKALPTPATSSQATRQHSEPCTEPIIVPDEDDEEELPMPPPAATAQKRLCMTPKGNKSAKGSDPEWEAASAASKRAVQSSPAKRGLSADSPIDLENLEPGLQSPRRLLFPVKATPNRSPVRKALNPRGATRLRDLAPDVEKENRAPTGTNAQVVTENEVQRPTTPIKKRNISLQPRTPFSSPFKAGKLVSPSPWNADIFASGGKRRACDGLVPATPEKRAPQTPGRANLSPTSELLEKIMSMADVGNTNPGISVDLTHTSPDHLPRLSPLDPTHNFDFGDDIFGTDMTMPSSPPPLFNLGDVAGDEVNGWGEFLPSSPEFNGVDYGLDIFEDIGGVAGVAEGECVKSEKCSSVRATPEATALTVDFSSYIDEATKNLVAGN